MSMGNRAAVDFSKKCTKKSTAVFSLKSFGSVTYPASHTAPDAPQKIIQTLYPTSRYSAGDLYAIRNNRIYMNENSKLMVSLVV